MMQATSVESVPNLARPESTVLAAEETARMVELLCSLTDGDWSRPTDCPDWDVRALAGHVLGATETFSSRRRFVQDLLAAARTARNRPLIDALSAVQVHDHAALSSDDLVARLAWSGARQVRWRSSRRLLRHLRIKQDLPDSSVVTLRAGYLFDVVLTRDCWMHRIDIARATGREPVLTADHDGRIVTDVVADWAQRHAEAFTMRLDGPAGGSYVQGHGGPHITLDAIEYCRIVSGRGSGTGLLACLVPF